jgi:L-rhamnose isomerase/sugar isomerase
VVLRFTDDSPYPGHRELRARQERMAVALTAAYAKLPAGVRLVIEFAVVEPCFYTPDVPDWGTAYAQCLHLGAAAQVMVDTGTYAQGRDPEFVGDLLHRDGRLGGVVLRSPSDDTADPLDLFLVVSELGDAVFGADVPYTLDPGANVAPGVLPLLRSVLAIQDALARASTLDVGAWHAAQNSGDKVTAHRLLMDAYTVDPGPILTRARLDLGIDPDPIGAYSAACQTELRTAERRAAAQRMAARRRALGTDRGSDWRPAPRRAVGSAPVYTVPRPTPHAT